MHSWRFFASSSFLFMAQMSLKHQHKQIIGAIFDTGETHFYLALDIFTLNFLTLTIIELQNFDAFQVDSTTDNGVLVYFIYY